MVTLVVSLSQGIKASSEIYEDSLLSNLIEELLSVKARETNGGLRVLQHPRRIAKTKEDDWHRYRDNPQADELSWAGARKYYNHADTLSEFGRRNSLFGRLFPVFWSPSPSGIPFPVVR